MSLILPFALVAVLAAGAPLPGDSIRPNDNRTPAGRLEDGVLSVRLEARIGLWAPEGADGPQITTAAFGEPGQPLQTPGPLIRVPVGTEVRITLANHLAATLSVYGLGTARGMNGDSVAIAPGSTRTVSFHALSE
jgi:FtsP/CotA-like multicopper oxidase with cupredoxin domain